MNRNEEKIVWRAPVSHRTVRGIYSINCIHTALRRHTRLVEHTNRRERERVREKSKQLRKRKASARSASVTEHMIFDLYFFICHFLSLLLFYLLFIFILLLIASSKIPFLWFNQQNQTFTHVIRRGFINEITGSLIVCFIFFSRVSSIRWYCSS